MLPSIYQDAQVRNVTPVCPERNRLGLGLELVSGEVVRVALDEAGVAFLAMCLQAYWSSAAGRQSPGSALMSKASMSVPSDGENV